MSNPSKQKSILFITQYFPPETGACPTRVSELSSQWEDTNHEVTVLTSAPDYPEGVIYDGYQNDWIHEEDYHGVTVNMIKTIPSASGRLPRRALKFIWFMLISLIVGLRLPRHDVVIATSPQPLTGVSGLTIAKVKGSKFVYEVRDLWPESITSLTDLPTVIFWPLEVVISFIYSQSDAVVIVSRAFEDEIISAGVKKSDIWFHPNGVSPSFFAHDGIEYNIEDELVSLLSDHFVVSYIGTIGRAHGLEVILDAAQVLSKKSDILFLIVGDGADAEYLQNETKKRELNSIHFTGRRPKEQIPDFLNLSDLSLVHLRGIDLFETVIPSKMFESMGAGVPIALGVEGESERILHNANAGKSFEPENGLDLANCIDAFYKNDRFRSECGQSGLEYARESVSWDSIAYKYSQNISELN